MHNSCTSIKHVGMQACDSEALDELEIDSTRQEVILILLELEDDEMDFLKAEGMKNQKNAGESHRRRRVTMQSLSSLSCTLYVRL